MRLTELIEGLPIRVVRPGSPPRRSAPDQTDPSVLDLTEDSRTVMPHSLFVARRGDASDGHRFIPDAVAAGAAAVLAEDEAALREVPEGVAALACDPGQGLAVSGILAERLFGKPSTRLALAGVTGTNGKTTVAHLTQRLVQAAGVRCGLIGTVEIDDGTERVRAEMTTPPGIELSRTLSVMVESGCEAAVMEVSSHALDQHRADALAFDTAIFTNLSGDHLDYHGTMEAYAAAKARLFELLRASPKQDPAAITNIDDPVGRGMTGPVTLGCTARDDPSAHWGVRVLEASITGTRVLMHGPSMIVSGKLDLVGAHNAMNTLQAVAAADELLRRSGLTDDGERARLLSLGLSLLATPPGRLERASASEDDVTVLVDFAHTDDALDKALGAVRGVLPAGADLWAVFGCGGDRDRAKRPRMGAVATGLADRVVVTSDNPRTETPSRIITEILSGVPAARRSASAVEVQADRRCAIEFAVTNARPGDVIVIAGKGHETEQILKDQAGGIIRTPFDDRAEARAALAARRSAAAAR